MVINNFKDQRGLLPTTIVALDGFGDDGAGGVTSGEVLGFGLYDAGDVAGRKEKDCYARSKKKRDC